MDQDDIILAYLQGSLSPQDVADFEIAIANSPDLAAEVAALRMVKNVMAEPPLDMPQDGWDRLSKTIAAQIPAQSTGKPANTNRPIRLSLLQAAGIAVAAVIGWQLVQSTLITPQGTGYLPASIEEPAFGLQVTFDADAELGQISEVLMQLDGTIISGPSAIGLYRVAFVDAASRDAAFEVLRARTDLTDEVLAD
ncbi:hypothetical protein [Algirhabdus cladophorae]|uniref:hypothetical protein n=1 Tax=Algirhabdus cladophorae TaxID=3377108 RepID=UPI003B849D8D